MAGSEDLARLVVRMEANLAEYHAGLQKATTQLRQFERNTSTKLDNMQKRFKRFGYDVRDTLGLFGAAFAVRGIANFSESIVEAADKVALMSKRLETFSGDANAFRKATEAANLLGTSVDKVADGMTRLLVVGKGIGITAAEAQRLTITFQQLGRIGGASGEEASRAFIQLTQGIGKGVLQGQDLKAVMSDVPLVAQAIAKEMGIATGELPKMAEEGRITGQIIRDALVNAAEEANRKFAELPQTLEQQKERLRTAWTNLLAEMDKDFHQSDIWKFFTGGLATAFENLTTRKSDNALDLYAVAAADLDKALRAATKAGLELDDVITPALLAAGGAETAVIGQFGKYGDFFGKTVREVVNLRSEFISLRQELEKSNALVDLTLQEDAAGEATKAHAKAVEQARAQIMAMGDPLQKLWAQYDKQKTVLEGLANTYPELASVAGQAIRDLTREFQASVAEAEYALMRIRVADEQAREAIGKPLEQVEIFHDSDLENTRVINERMEEIRRKTFNLGDRTIRLEGDFFKAKKGAESFMDAIKDEGARRAFSFFSQAIYDMGSGMDDFAKSTIDAFRRILADYATRQLFELFASLGSSGGGGGILGSIGGFFGDLLGLGGGGGAPGSVPTVPKFPARASGGPVTAGRSYLVGEQGPELFTPAQSGTITPNEGMGTKIVINQNMDQRGASVDFIKAFPAILQENNRQMIQALRDAKSRGAF